LRAQKPKAQKILGQKTAKNIFFEPFYCTGGSQNDVGHSSNAVADFFKVSKK
jgi:hypothetical protein